MAADRDVKKAAETAERRNRVIISQRHPMAAPQGPALYSAGVIL